MGGSTASQIDTAGDVDWFAVTLVAGKRYRIDLEGEDTGDGTLADPFLRGIYDSSGTLISSTEDDNRGEDDNSRVYFKATADGIYYVAAGAEGTGTGTYTLSVVEDDFADDTDTRGSLTLGVNKRGDIETAGDEDWVQGHVGGEQDLRDRAPGLVER